MKKLLILSLLAVFASCAVPLNLIEHEETKKTISVNDTKENLFVKSNLWLVDSFVSAKSVVQYSDKEAGVIAGKFIIRERSASSGTGTIEAIVKIFVNDNTARISIKPLPYSRYERYGTRGQSAKQAVDLYVGLLITDFEEYINKGMY